MSIDQLHRRPLPKYQRLREDLILTVRDELEVNDPVPSEAELQTRYGMSRMTVRKAVDQLVNEQMLNRVSGVGTSVADHATNVELHLSSSTEDVLALGRSTTRHVFALDVIPADERLARELAAPVGDPLIHLERARSIDGTPVCHERSYLRASLVPGFPKHWHDESLFDLLDRTWNLRPTWSQQRISAKAAGPEVAAHLRIRAGAPVLRIRQRAFKDSTLVEYCESSYSSDGYGLSVTVNRSGLLPSP